MSCLNPGDYPDYMRDYRIFSLNDAELTHSKRLVLYPEFSEAFGRKYEHLKPVPPDFERMVNRMINDDAFCHAIQEDYVFWGAVETGGREAVAAVLARLTEKKP